MNQISESVFNGMPTIVWSAGPKNVPGTNTLAYFGATIEKVL